MKNIKCTKNHSGNTHLTKIPKGWECDGCGQIYVPSDFAPSARPATSASGSVDHVNYGSRGPASLRK